MTIQETTAQDLEELKKLILKINQAYRIRMICLQRRNKALKVAASPKDAFPTLKRIADKELQVLKILKLDQANELSHLAKAITALAVISNNFESFDQKPIQIHVNGKSYPIKKKSIQEFINGYVQFLEKAEDNVSRIHDWILKERELINDEKKYIAAWKQELQADKELMKDFNRLVNKNRKVLDVYHPAVRNIIGALPTAPVAILFPQLLKCDSEESAVVFGVTLLGLLAIGVFGFLSLTHEELVQDNRSEAMLNEASKSIR